MNVSMNRLRSYYKCTTNIKSNQITSQNDSISSVTSRSATFQRGKGTINTGEISTEKRQD